MGLGMDMGTSNHGMVTPDYMEEEGKINHLEPITITCAHTITTSNLQLLHAPTLATLILFHLTKLNPTQP